MLLIIYIIYIYILLYIYIYIMHFIMIFIYRRKNIYTISRKVKLFNFTVNFH